MQVHGGVLLVSVGFPSSILPHLEPEEGPKQICYAYPCITWALFSLDVLKFLHFNNLASQMQHCCDSIKTTKILKDVISINAERAL